MEETKKLKEFIEEAIKHSPIGALPLLQKMIELEAIENWINVMYGVNLDIRVVPTEAHEGRYFGTSLIEALNKD